MSKHFNTNNKLQIMQSSTSMGFAPTTFEYMHQPMLTPGPVVPPASLMQNIQTNPSTFTLPAAPNTNVAPTLPFSNVTHPPNYILNVDKTTALMCNNPFLGGKDLLKEQHSKIFTTDNVALNTSQKDLYDPFESHLMDYSQGSEYYVEHKTDVRTEAKKDLNDFDNCWPTAEECYLFDQMQYQKQIHGENSATAPQTSGIKKKNKKSESIYIDFQELQQELEKNERENIGLINDSDSSIDSDTDSKSSLSSSSSTQKDEQETEKTDSTINDPYSGSYSPKSKDDISRGKELESGECSNDDDPYNLMPKSKFEIYRKKKMSKVDEPYRFVKPKTKSKLTNRSPDNLDMSPLKAYVKLLKKIRDLPPDKSKVNRSRSKHAAHMLEQIKLTKVTKASAEQPLTSRMSKLSKLLSDPAPLSSKRLSHPLLIENKSSKASLSQRLGIEERNSMSNISNTEQENSSSISASQSPNYSAIDKSYFTTASSDPISIGLPNEVNRTPKLHQHTEQVVNDDKINTLKSPIRPNLDSRIRSLMNEESPEKKSQFPLPPGQPLARPPSPFLDKVMYRIWHKQTTKFRSRYSSNTYLSVDPTKRQKIGSFPRDCGQGNLTFMYRIQAANNKLPILASLTRQMSRRNTQKYLDKKYANKAKAHLKFSENMETKPKVINIQSEQEIELVSGTKPDLEPKTRSSNAALIAKLDKLVEVRPSASEDQKMFEKRKTGLVNMVMERIINDLKSSLKRELETKVLDDSNDDENVGKKFRVM